MVEHEICNFGVGGSRPFIGSTLKKGVYDGIHNRAVASTAEGAIMYPKDRRHRFLIGKHKGEIRAAGMVRELSDKQSFERWANRRRNTTTLCSCSMCGNPRRKARGKDKLTMQELKLEKIEDLLFENMGVRRFDRIDELSIACRG